MTDVILAVASPPGRSVRGIVRCSGERAFEVLSPHVAGVEPRRGAFGGRVTVGGLEAPCIAMVFPGPRSYTGEDSLEIQLPGNPFLLERVIDALIESGRARGIEARRAEGGEFTARAFFNGRLSLTQAEGVAATIAARSDAQLRAARLLSTGKLAELSQRLADRLAAALALVEAGIDFTDQEDVVAIEPGDLRARLASVAAEIDAHLSRAVAAEQLEAIPWVVLTGKANAGKSTLFNALLGRRRAVVSQVPGTTRDVLAEPLAIPTPRGRAEVMLVDLAGSVAAGSELDRKIAAAAAAAVRRAELVLHCIPVNEPPVAPAAGAVVVRTKADLPQAGATGDVSVSARRGTGLDRLRDCIAGRLADRAVCLAADAMALAPRHEAALRSARRHVGEAAGATGHAELAAAAMRAALNDLAALAGDVTPDDILGRIFATFCIGK